MAFISSSEVENIYIYIKYKYFSLREEYVSVIAKNFLEWVNEGNHLHIIPMQQRGDLTEVWKRLVKVRHYL